jgi:hypothetical protein
LWKEIRQRVPECANESDVCWTRVSWLGNKDKKEIIEDFKPPIPKGKNEWLTTEDIDRVLLQYQRVFPNFVFIGTFPIDFETIFKDDMKYLKKVISAPTSKTRYIGIVLNLDSHDEPGSHWVAIVIDKHDRSFEYFDSFGDPAPDEVKELFQTCCGESKGYKMKVNTVQHQRQNNECGNYSINFIVQRISGRTFEQITRNVVRDAEMNKRRSIFFDPHRMRAS